MEQLTDELIEFELHDDFRVKNDALEQFIPGDNIQGVCRVFEAHFHEEVDHRLEELIQLKLSKNKRNKMRFRVIIVKLFYVFFDDIHGK